MWTNSCYNNIVEQETNWDIEKIKLRNRIAAVFLKTRLAIAQHFENSTVYTKTKDGIDFFPSKMK